MEIKTALEVIIADLDDVKKLIANLKRIEQVPRLEVELCLSKCRNIQDIMHLMKDLDLQTVEEVDKVDNETKDGLRRDAMPVRRSTEGEGGPVRRSTEGEGEPDVSDTEKEITEYETKDGISDTKKVIAKNEIKDGDSDKEERTDNRSGRRVIGERFAQREGRNESLAKDMPVINLSAKLMEKPIPDIGKAIGINDRFTYIRELFQGDSEKFRGTIDYLNNLTSWEDALLYINENFNWDYEDQTTRELLVTIKRKLFIYE